MVACTLRWWVYASNMFAHLLRSSVTNVCVNVFINVYVNVSFYFILFLFSNFLLHVSGGNLRGILVAWMGWSLLSTGGLGTPECGVSRPRGRSFPGTEMCVVIAFGAACCGVGVSPGQGVVVTVVVFVVFPLGQGVYEVFSDVGGLGAPLSAQAIVDCLLLW
jgi:hypothetical protein